MWWVVSVSGTFPNEEDVGNFVYHYNKLTDDVDRFSRKPREGYHQDIIS